MFEKLKKSKIKKKKKREYRENGPKSPKKSKKTKFFFQAHDPQNKTKKMSTAKLNSVHTEKGLWQLLSSVEWELPGGQNCDIQ